MGFFAKLKAVIMKSAATKIATAAVVVAVVGGSTAGIAYAAGYTGAEAAVGMAIMKTFAGQSASHEKIFGFQELFSALEDQGAELGVEFTLPELSLEKLGLSDRVLANVDVCVVVKADAEDRLYAVLDLKAANTTLLSGTVYLDNEQLQLSVPKLFKSVLVLNHNEENLAQSMKASYAAEYLGLTEEQIDTFVEYLPKQTEEIPKGELQKKLFEKLADTYQRILSEAKLRRVAREDVSLAGKVQKCNVYRLELDARKVGADLQDTVVVKFYICKDRLVKVTMDWNRSVTAENGPATEPGRLELIFSPKGNPTENMQVVYNETSTEFSFYYKKMNGEFEAAPLKGKHKDILAMTKEEFTALEEEVKKNIAWLMLSMLGLFQ